MSVKSVKNFRKIRPTEKLSKYRSPKILKNKSWFQFANNNSGYAIKLANKENQIYKPQVAVSCKRCSECILQTACCESIRQMNNCEWFLFCEACLAHLAKLICVSYTLDIIIFVQLCLALSSWMSPSIIFISCVLLCC